VTALLADEVGEGPFHILRDSYVGVYRINGASVVGDAIDGFIEDTLPAHDGGSGSLGKEKEVAG